MVAQISSNQLLPLSCFRNFVMVTICCSCAARAQSTLQPPPSCSACPTIDLPLPSSLGLLHILPMRCLLMWCLFLETPPSSVVPWFPSQNSTAIAVQPMLCRHNAKQHNCGPTKRTISTPTNSHSQCNAHTEPVEAQRIVRTTVLSRSEIPGDLRIMGLPITTTPRTGSRHAAITRRRAAQCNYIGSSATASPSREHASILSMS